MGKPSHVLIIFEIVTAISLERNHMEVRNEGEPSYLLLVLESQKDSHLERSLLNVRNVESFHFC
jgi:nitrate reductase NapAB chaperone NapD